MAFVPVRPQSSSVAASNIRFRGVRVNWTNVTTITINVNTPHNFAIIPEAAVRDPFWEAKRAAAPHKPHYKEIHMPKNSPYGLLIGALSFVFSFAIIWYIWWLALVSLVAMLAGIIIRLFERHTEYTVSVDEIAKIEARRT